VDGDPAGTGADHTRDDDGLAVIDLVGDGYGRKFTGGLRGAGGAPAARDGLGGVEVGVAGLAGGNEEGNDQQAREQEGSTECVRTLYLPLRFREYYGRFDGCVVIRIREKICSMIQECDRNHYRYVYLICQLIKSGGHFCFGETSSSPAFSSQILERFSEPGAIIARATLAGEIINIHRTGGSPACIAATFGTFTERARRARFFRLSAFLAGMDHDQIVNGVKFIQSYSIGW
jgi:hypothetical protein